MESYSGGSSRRKYVSKADIANLKKGGIKAKQIKAKSDKHHNTIEIPNAEKILEHNIETAFNQNNNSNPTNTNLNNLKTKLYNSKKTFFQKIIDFIKRIFLQPKV